MMDPIMADWQVYVLECADRSLYTGIARDVGARVERHNLGLGARYTRGRRPVRLVYVEVAPDRGAALRREHAIKQLGTKQKRALVQGLKTGDP
jgi:putative endonuclease